MREIESRRAFDQPVQPAPWSRATDPAPPTATASDPDPYSRENTRGASRVQKTSGDRSLPASVSARFGTETPATQAPTSTQASLAPRMDLRARPHGRTA